MEATAGFCGSGDTTDAARGDLHHGSLPRRKILRSPRWASSRLKEDDFDSGWRGGARVGGMRYSGRFAAAAFGWAARRWRSYGAGAGPRRGEAGNASASAAARLPRCRCLSDRLAAWAVAAAGRRRRRLAVLEVEWAAVASAAGQCVPGGGGPESGRRGAVRAARPRGRLQRLVGGMQGAWDRGDGCKRAWVDARQRE